MSLIVADGSEDIWCLGRGLNRVLMCVSHSGLAQFLHLGILLLLPSSLWVKEEERWLFGSAPLTDVWYCFSSRGLPMAWTGTNLRHWSRKESSSSPPLSLSLLQSLFPLLHKFTDDMRSDLLFYVPGVSDVINPLSCTYLLCRMREYCKWD